MPAAPPKVGSGTRLGKRAVNVWLPETLVEAMHAYLGSLRPEPSVTTCMKTALEDYLVSKGFWPPEK